MKKYIAISVTLFFVFSIELKAQTPVELERIIQKGNEFYKLKQYDKAELAYKEVIDQEKLNTTATFNRANALYRQSKTDEAMKALDDVIMNANNAELKGKAHYNKGAILSAQKNLEESIEAYKNALRQYPDDKEARENLQKALTELKKKNPPPPPKEDKKKQQKKQQQQPKMDQKEAEQRLKLLEQKEKEVQQRLQNERSKAGAGQPKDW